MIGQVRKVYRILIKGYLRNIYWNIHGKTIKDPSLPNTPKSIMFICKGNICRSPFAHYVAQKIKNNRSKGNLSFDSAGIEAKQDNQSPENAVSAASDYDIELKTHQPKKLDKDMVKAADMVIGMETWHMKTLKKQFPGHKDKFFLLPLFEHNRDVTKNGFYRYNIEDPYGRAIDEFQKCFTRIERCVEGLFKEIENS